MKTLIAAAVALVGLALPLATRANVVTLNFEGMQDQEQILNYYNGGFGGLGSGPGPNYGITFGPDSLALNSGNYGNNPSAPSIAFFLTGPGNIMNVPAGFDTGFSFYYAAYANGSVSVYDGLNGTGNLLATLPLPTTPNAAYQWIPIGVSFAGTAESVLFGGSANQIGFDNITLGASTPTGTPDGGATAVLLGAALTGLVGLRRRLS